MGVRGLKTFIEKHQKIFILEERRLRDLPEIKSLVIDGHNVCHQLFSTFQQINSHFFGGDYDHFAQVCTNFFEALRHCGITPYVIYDGAHDDVKFKTMKDRAEYHIKMAAKTSLGEGEVVLPMMSYETFRDVVTRSEGVQHLTCNFEADHQMAAQAVRLKCPILSMDTDFLIYNLPEGVVRMDDEEVKKFVNDAIDGTNRNPILKIYKISVFWDKVGGINPSILPLWATLLGNDRVNSVLFKPFFDKIILPSKCGDIQAEDRLFRILGWLKDCKSVQNALKILLSKYSEKDRPKIELVIEKSMAAYTKLTCEVKGNFSDPTQLTGVGSLESFAKKQIPNWFMLGISIGSVPVHALDALVLRKVMLPTQVSVTSDPSPYQCSATLREFLYTVLLLWDGPYPPQLKELFVEEHDRDQSLKLQTQKVRAITTLEKVDFWIPSLSEIKKENETMAKSDRISLLLKVLGVTTAQLNEFKFEPRIHFLIATIVHWMRNSRPSVGRLHLESLIVCFHRAGFLGNRIQSGDDVVFKRHRETPDEISPETFDCAVVHSFAQFQCCLQMALYVNQILLLPAPDPLPVLAFNGTFLHNFYRKLHYRQQGPQIKFGVVGSNCQQPGPNTLESVCDAIETIRGQTTVPS